MEEGKKVTDGQIILLRKLIDLPHLNKKAEVVVEQNTDGTFTQVMPCQAFFESDWSLVE